MELLLKHIEALIFCSKDPVSIQDLQACMAEMFDAAIPQEDIETAVATLTAKYQTADFAFEIKQAAGGYQFLTKPEYQASLAILLRQSSKRRLSTSAMETLAIIAYKQPVSKTQIEQIRGVNCDYTLQKLLEKDLIEIQGKADTPGRPLLYGTNKRFMEYLGINSLRDLPQPKDLAMEQNEIGTPDEA